MIRMFQKILTRLGKSDHHYTWAQQAFLEQRYFEAVALYRTCLALREKAGKDIYTQLAKAYHHLGLYQTEAQVLAQAGSAEQIQQFPSDNEGLTQISHHTYVRLKNLADQIKKLYGDNLSTVRILDIGGGAGYLACFLPDVQYVLVEPTVNHLSALNLPFGAKTFDCVVACHVLEHIADDQKDAFLDNLCTLASSHVLLLNPFLMGDEHLDKIVERDLKMVWEVTAAPWAREHLDSGTPSLNVIKDYAQDHRYPLQILGNNSHMSTLLYVYMEYFATAANKQAEFEKINRTFNQTDPAFMANENFPNDFTCILDVSKPSTGLPGEQSS